MKKITFLFCFLFAVAASAQIGVIDPTFNTITGPDAAVNMVTLQPDGKMVLVGSFKNYDGVSRNGVARINEDGSLDESFNPGTGVVSAAEYISMAVLQPDGKMLISGDFTSFDGVSRNRIARLNADGSLDNSFNPGTGANSRVVSISLQPDGKVIMGGQFTTFNSLAQNRIARLNADGTLDSSFVVGSGTNSYIWTTCLQPDGKVIIGGGFTNYNGTFRQYIARLNSDGSIDTTFAVPVTANQAVLTSALQPDGKVVIGGYFTAYAGTSRNRIARINADGTLDTTFNPGTGINNYTTCLAVQPDGKIMVSGDFVTYNGSTRNKMARVNADGSLDSGFGGTGMNSIVYHTALQPDGKMVVGGNFTTYNGIDTHPFLVRLYAYDPNALSVTSLSAESPLCQGQQMSINYNAVGFYQAGNIFTAQLSDATGNFENPVNIGTVSATSSGSINITTPSDAVGSGFRIRVVSDLPVTVGSDNGSDLSINVSSTYYADADGDGFGNTDASIEACGPSAGFVVVGGDCDDASAAVNPGQSEILYNGIDDNCSGELDEGNQITTKVINALCGNTLNTMSSLISSSSLPNITRYRFEVTNTTTNAVQVIERVQNYFSLTQLASYDYSTTYSIKVELQRNNVWLGYYGPACLVSSPNVLLTGGPASIVGSQCNTVLPSISSLIATTSLPGITSFKFRITNNSNPMAPNQVQIKETPMNWFSLTSLATFHYGTTYTVEVAFKTNGAYTSYGSPCTITTPPVPQLTNCNAVIPTVGTLIAAPSLNQVTMYRFQIVNMSTGITTTVDRIANYFTFHNIPMFTAGGDYSVQISVKSSGSWSPFGEACMITAPLPARISAPKEMEISAIAYPNPFSDQYQIDFRTSIDEPVSIKVYDMTGRLIESTMVNPDELQSTVFGENYPSGVYNVIVIQDNFVKTLRIIKR